IPGPTAPVRALLATLLVVVVVVLVAGVLDHVAACLGAVAARLGTALHVLVVGVLLAGFGAEVTDPGASRASGRRRRPPAGDDLGGQGAEVAAIGARRQAVGVLLLAPGDQLGAVPGARLALQHAPNQGVATRLLLAVQLV